MEADVIAVFIQQAVALLSTAITGYVVWFLARYIVNNLMARMVLKGMQVEYGDFKVNKEMSRFEPGDFGLFKSRLHYLDNDEMSAWLQNSLITKKDIRFTHTNGGSNGKNDKG